MSAISDLYRVYTIAEEGKESPIPTLPRSENGRAQIAMYVHNQMWEKDIDVYWVDYKGKERYKGTIRSHLGRDLNIMTWVGHPWTFRRSQDQQLLLHFVPFKVPPITADEAKAIDALGRDNSIGHYEFTIAEPDNVSSGNETSKTCSVIDGIFPYPPNKIKSVNHALEFSCQQMEREEVSPRILLKYLNNIALHPSDSKYRQIRTNNHVFWNNVWINGGRGILHSLGFEERGAYIEMGPHQGQLPKERLKQLLNAIVMLEELAKDMEDIDRNEIVRPFGTNGNSGRAGWRV